MILSISKSGQVKAVYRDDFDWRSLGRLMVQRASQVEPDSLGFWWADLTMSNGPKVGPFVRRQDAIAAEVGWLEKNCL